MRQVEGERERDVRKIYVERQRREMFWRKTTGFGLRGRKVHGSKKWADVEFK